MNRNHQKRKNGNNRASHACPCNQQIPGPCAIHDPMDLQELETRRQMCDAAIKVVIEENDPYNQINNYRLQAANILAAIRKRKDKSMKPPTTVVGLNPGSLAGKVQKADGSMS